MPFTIIRNDITLVAADAIVNTANPQPVIGSGTDAAIHAAAGAKLLAAREKIGTISPGTSAITPGYKLNAKYVIHTVGPAWIDGKHDEPKTLARCYESALALAASKRCKSIAFPLISSGNYGFPKALALQIAVDAIRSYLQTNEMDIQLVVFDRETYRISENLFFPVFSYIDEKYTGTKDYETYLENLPSQKRRLSDLFSVSAPKASNAESHADIADDAVYSSNISNVDYEDTDSSPQEFQSAQCPMPNAAPPAPESARPTAPHKKQAAPKLSHFTLLDRLRKTDAGFSETLLQLIDRSGHKDSEIYKKANIDRKHFSKIRNNPSYQPSKSTAIAFAIALELDLEGTKDLIGRAGYALTNSSKFDVIIEYFIVNQIYDIYEINMTLFEFDQTLLA